MSTPFHRVRWVLETSRDVRILGRQNAMLYALLSEANRTVEGGPVFPDSMLLDAPEVGRTVVRRGEPFAFGATILASDGRQAAASVARLTDGLVRCGGSSNPRSQGLGGNFLVTKVEDLVAGVEWTADVPRLARLSIDAIDRELQRLLDHDRLTLVFRVPLRLERPKSDCSDHRSFFDDRYFDANGFVRRLVRRLESIGIVGRRSDDRRPAEEARSGPIPTILDNRLQWLDLAYGGPRGKTLGGSVGLVRVRVDDPRDRAAIVWGQYARVGKNTAFGFGAYRVLEAGPEPAPCRRGMELLEVAWGHPQRDSIVERSALDPGVLQHAIASVKEGNYRPDPSHRIEIGQGEKRRELLIPSRRDRALQRLILETIGPALDQLFEASSFAWRRGLGRHSSARAIAKAWQAGYRWALKADFDRFFDSIDHETIERKLFDYLDAPELVELVMIWLRHDGRRVGLPTGAPLSPLLGNLMLDRFDEAIAAEGSRLVRYGDDFLILCRDEWEAKRLHGEAMAQAEELSLRLNHDPNPILDLEEPFEFLGFSFRKRDAWETEDRRPRSLDQLGWHDASVKGRRPTVCIGLPGEVLVEGPGGVTAIFGPGIRSLDIGPDRVIGHYETDGRAAELPLDDLETLVVLGRCATPPESIERLVDRGVLLILADQRGEPYAVISGDDDEHAPTILAQIDAWHAPERSLGIASALVSAKLRNYAALAAACDSGNSPASRLRDLADKALQSDTINTLRGIEGSGAAIWYGRLGGYLGDGFRFERRVSPSAEDPINVLLNIGHSMLYRLSKLAARAAGLMPSIGFLHVPNERFAALAADLQEPFRALVDRAVIEASRTLRPSQFERSEGGKFALRLAPNGARRFQQLLWTSLETRTVLGGSDTPVSYRVLLERQARNLRNHLRSSDVPFAPPVIR